jgi:hypothetical protein
VSRFVPDALLRLLQPEGRLTLGEGDRARVAEELQRRRETPIGEHYLKLALSVLDRQVH